MYSNFQPLFLLRFLVWRGSEFSRIGGSEFSRSEVWGLSFLGLSFCIAYKKMNSIFQPRLFLFPSFVVWRGSEFSRIGGSEFSRSEFSRIGGSEFSCQVRRLSLKTIWHEPWFFKYKIFYYFRNLQMPISRFILIKSKLVSWDETGNIVVIFPVILQLVVK